MACFKLKHFRHQIFGTGGVFQIKTFSAPDFRHGPVPKTCCRKFQTEDVLFPAAQETEKFSKPKKGKKKFVNPAAQETALGGIIGCKDKTASWHLIGFPTVVT